MHVINFSHVVPSFDITYNGDISKLSAYSNNINADVIVLELLKTESVQFNDILKDCEIKSLDDLVFINCLSLGHFDNFVVSAKHQNAIRLKIKFFDNYNSIWSLITSKEDYSLYTFKARKLPYFNHQNNTWGKACLDVFAENYTTELDDDVPIINAREAAAASVNNSVNENENEESEVKVVYKNNNFLTYKPVSISLAKENNKILSIIDNLISLKMKNHAIALICKLMTVPDYCHICLQPMIWNILNPEIAKSKDLAELVKYCMWYAFYILKQEEVILFSNMSQKARFLITLNDACKLPTWDLAHLDKNPYVMQLTDDTNKSRSMIFHLVGKRALNTPEEFKKRFKIATGGAFTNINLDVFNAAVTGSILIPCVQKSPLESNFEDTKYDTSRKCEMNKEYPYQIDTPDDMAFYNYLEYYYPSYVSLPDDDFQKAMVADNSASKVEVKADYSDSDGFDTDVSDDINYSGTDDDSDEEPLITKREKVSKPKVINKSVPCADYNQIADIDISITCKSHDIFKTRANALYELIKANCIHRGDVLIKEIITISSSKFIIYGPGLPRFIDVFRIPYHPIKMVSKFHINAVKMYYDGTVHMLRSCVSSLLSGINENYKWFSCNKVPADVLLKYAQRGITTILNTSERDAIALYIDNEPRWSNVIKSFDLTSKDIYCCVNKSHQFFRPGMTSSGIRKNLKPFEQSNPVIFNNILQITDAQHVFEYGTLITHDNKKIYAPDANIIQQVIDYIESQ